MKKFLLKHKIPEYLNDPNKYTKTFIKMHKLNMSDRGSESSAAQYLNTLQGIPLLPEALRLSSFNRSFITSDSLVEVNVNLPA